jgi:hypothetical protein
VVTTVAETTGVSGVAAVAALAEAAEAAEVSAVAEVATEGCVTPRRIGGLAGVSTGELSSVFQVPRLSAEMLITRGAWGVSFRVTLRGG